MAIPDIHAVIDRAVAATAAKNPSTSALQQDTGYVRQQEADGGYSAAPAARAMGTAASVVVTDDFVNSAGGFSSLFFVFT